jgi:hypothetical protein
MMSPASTVAYTRDSAIRPNKPDHLPAELVLFQRRFGTPSDKITSPACSVSRNETRKCRLCAFVAFGKWKGRLQRKARSSRRTFQPSFHSKIYRIGASEPESGRFPGKFEAIRENFVRIILADHFTFRLTTIVSSIFADARSSGLNRETLIRKLEEDITHGRPSVGTTLHSCSRCRTQPRSDNDEFYLNIKSRPRFRRKTVTSDFEY